MTGAFKYEVYMCPCINPLLHRLFLDHDIIFYFKQQKKLRYVLNTFENILENGAFAPKEQMNIVENGAFAPKEQMLHFP